MIDIDKIEAWFRHGPPNMVCAHDVLAMIAELRAAREVIGEIPKGTGAFFDLKAILKKRKAYDAAIGGEGEKNASS